MSTHDVTSLIRYEEMTRVTWRKFRPIVGAYFAAVAVDRRGDLRLVERRPAASEVYYSPPPGVFWVDVSVHRAPLKLELPTMEGVFGFRAEVDLSWQIRKPIEAVRDKLASGEDVYRPFLENQLRNLSRQFEADRFPDAEQHINTHFVDRSIDLPSGVTLLDCKVKLAPEDSTLIHIQQRTHDRRQEERREAAHKAQLHDVHLQHDETETEHRLAVQNAMHMQDIATLEQRHRLELERQRMDFYAAALQAGELGAISLKLASNREDVNEVIQLLMQQRQLDFESAHGALKALLEQRLVNRRDVQDIMARATKVVADHWSKTPQTAVPAEEAQRLAGSQAATVDAAEVVDASDYADDEDDIA
ncbi:hypothetical protein [Nocardia brasiliensis]|uniref:hypothetical protein n=1 Tax=Nocardia brasiliensis TaxID=37326 RepID=UPI0024548396|nr:hypothetical protein [Nocardia brasiliensis]